MRELYPALAIEVGEATLYEDNIPDVATIVPACVGLVAIDKQNDIIRLVHHTTQEYPEHIKET